VSYHIEITREALRALAKLDKPMRRRLQSAIDRLQNDPHPNGSIALQGLRGAFRVRVGDYRVIYTVDDGRLLVVVVDLGHRRENYRDLRAKAQSITGEVLRCAAPRPGRRRTP
jgi:mRNA interferase RelE/StbE